MIFLLDEEDEASDTKKITTTKINAIKIKRMFIFDVML